MNSFYILLSQSVSSEEKCYPVLILPSKEVAANTEVTKISGEQDRVP